MTNPNPFSTDPFGHDPADGTNMPTNTGATGSGDAGNAYGVSTPPSYPPQGSQINPYATSYATQSAPSDGGTDRTDQTDRTGQTDQQRKHTSNAFQASRAGTGSRTGGTGGTATDAPPLDEPYYGCPPQEAFLRFFKKYVTVSGRASRSEYWWWMLIAFGIALVLRFLSSATDGTLGFLGTIWTLGTLIPGFAIAIRRLHDSNRPGWLVVTPYALWFVGAIFILGGAASALFGAIGSLGGGTGHAAAGVGGGIALLIGVIAVLAGFVVNIVLMVAPSKPEGARFDAV